MLKITIKLIFATFLFSANNLFAQEEEKSNLQTYTPSVLLKKGQIEVQLFNNIYTQTSYSDVNGDHIDLNGRSSYYTGFMRFLIGTSKSSKINIGFDINLKSVRNDPDASSSFFKVLKFGNDSISRTALTSLGPKIKISPFNNFKGFSIQSAFWIPVTKDLEGKESGKPWLAWDRYTWWNQFFYDKTLSDKFQIFAEADLLFRFERDFELKNTMVDIPLSTFVNYFPIKNATLYAMVQYSPTVTSSSTFYVQVGVGGKYQITKHLNIELLYTDFIYSKNSGTGQTFNLGLRFIN